MNTRHASSTRSLKGFTLIEVVVSILIGTIMVWGIVHGYTQSTRRAEWAAYSLAAQSLAMQGVEMTRAASWDPQASGYSANVANTNNNGVLQAYFPTRTNILDIPISKTNIVFATNFTTITDVSVNPPLKMIRVDTVWPFHDRGVFTNSVVTYRAPAQ